MNENTDVPKRRQVNILLDEEDIEKLDILAREAGYLTRSSMLRLLLRRAWKAYISQKKTSEKQSP
ncbi:ribbon-helix-helix protein, CopG family [Bellilinea sp.]